jgi:hypothetical protein
LTLIDLPPEKVALITVLSPEYAAIGDITLPIMDRYCHRHGYTLKVGPYTVDSGSLLTYGDRGKIEMFINLFNDFTTIMFLDVDAVIMNSAIRVEDVLANRPFLWTYGPDGPCSGFWIARCYPKVHHMLATVQNRAPLVGNVRTREVVGPPHKIVLEMEPRGQSDQEVMRSLMGIPPFSDLLQHCVSLKSAGHCFDFRELGYPPIWDPLGNYEQGDWIYTVPGAPLKRRIELLKAAAEKAT